MAGRRYETNVSAKGFLGAQRQAPYIQDGDSILAESIFSRFCIEKTYGFDFHKRRGPAEKALGSALEPMCEERLYWLMVDSRWLIDANLAPIVGRSVSTVAPALKDDDDSREGARHLSPGTARSPFSSATRQSSQKPSRRHCHRFPASGNPRCRPVADPGRRPRP
jgi:hypothetical protein